MLAEDINQWSALVLVVITLANSVLTWLNKQSTDKAEMHARQANEAINQRPPGSPKAYDLIQSTRDETMRVGVMLEVHTRRHERLEKRMEKFDDRLDRVEHKLSQLSDSWEPDEETIRKREAKGE